MPTKLRKTRKMRGSKTCGYGSKKKHRGKGSRGGKGYAGAHKHKWTYITKYEPEHFGKRGFSSLRKRAKTINLDELKRIAEKEGNEIDLKKLGFNKLLGRGKIEEPLTVKVQQVSKLAKEKIEKAGGRILSEA
ncbi:MAG: uL15 family ribosomal protein [Candidatus Aenigmatarchaeota archaeon]